MQNTTNFNFNLPEGTDLWNYLTQTNPNFTALDSILKSVQDGTVTTATEVTSGTAHAVTRTLSDANVIRFTATGTWTLGDTMTIDGTPVTVVKPNGTSLQTGDYIIGSEVLGILRATQFTVYVGGGSSSVDAADVTFDNDNTHPWLTASDVEDAIKETATEVDAIGGSLSSLASTVSDIEYKVVAETGSGSDTYGNKLSTIYTAYSQLSYKEQVRSKIIIDNVFIYPLINITHGWFAGLSSSSGTSSDVGIQLLKTDVSKFYARLNFGAATDYSSTATTSNIQLVIS